MTTHEDIARQRLTLVVNNPHPRMPRRASTLERIVYHVALWAMAFGVLAFWYGVSVLVLSLEKAI
jgi:hypothetical protein